MASTITATVGYRVTMLVGAMLACVGFICSSLMSQLWHLYLTIGCTTGIGFGLIFTPAIGVIPFYFTQYRRFAVTTATMGVGIGVIFYSRLHSILLSTYGWQNAMQIEAALALVLFFCGVVVRDPPRTPTESTTTIKTRHRSFSYFMGGKPRERGGSSENLTITQIQTISMPASIRQVAENGDATGEPNSRIRAGGIRLFLIPKFYFILLQGLTLMCSSLFLVTTAPFLTKTQHWSSLHAASALTFFGLAALAMRISICLFNALAPRLAEKLHVAVPIAAGNFMIISAACVFFFTVRKEQQYEQDDRLQKLNQTMTTVSDTEKSLFSELNAILLLAFAAVNGAGHAVFLAYQTALIVDMLGPANLTAGFGYLNFIWGVATLLLYPMAGWISDLFNGQMRYEYMLGVACGVFSLLALGMTTVLHRRDEQLLIGTTMNQVPININDTNEN